MADRRPRDLARAASARLDGWGITRGVLALCLLWLAVAGPLVADLSAQPAPRLALTGAIVDDHDIKIDGYRLGPDRTDRDGHVYSDKAPGQELLVIPMYAGARLVGADPARVDRIEGNLTLWWVTLWSAGVPAVALILLVAAAAHRRGTPIPLPALATLAFGTLLLPFAVNLYGHVLGAALGFGAWLVVDRAPTSIRRAAVAGALVGVAVLVEYPLAIVGVVLLGLLVARRAWIAAAAYLAAGVPSALLLGVYQAAAFGSPLASGYGSKAAHQGATLLVTGIPRPTTAMAMLFGSRGLLLFSPVVVVGLVGLVQRWRASRDDGALVGLAVAVGFLLLQAGWQNAYGGEMPGPRYVIPMLPFLGLGLAHAWNRTPATLRRWVAGISITSMVVASAGDHILDNGTVAVAGHLRQIAVDGANPTVWSVALGPAGWVLYAATVAAALWWYLRQARAEAVTPSTDEAEVLRSALA